MPDVTAAADDNAEPPPLPPVEEFPLVWKMQIKGLVEQSLCFPDTSFEVHLTVDPAMTLEQIRATTNAASTYATKRYLDRSNGKVMFAKGCVVMNRATSKTTYKLRLDATEVGPNR
jgi:hypothetical protein